MTSMQHPPAGQGSDHADLPGIPPVNAEATSADLHGHSFGSRLHAAREARGLSIELCAHSLKLPVRVLRQLERDASDGMDSKIYLGSYVGKYGRYLGISEATIRLEQDRIRQSETPLVATGGISHSRFLFDRYATAATYVVLTAVIVVPMIWLGVRGTLDRDLTHLAPLDSAPVVQLDTRAAAGKVTTDHAITAITTPPEVVRQAPEEPLMASMAPFPGLESAGLSSQHPVAPPPADVNDGSHSLSLSLTAASWVEVTERDGTRLEYGLLPAGSNKTYHSDQPIEVRIGNADGAQVSIDGKAVGLADFRHANVAHFRMQVDDGTASATSL